MAYPLIRRLLFKLDPEIAHHLALSTFQTLYRLGLTAFFFKKNIKPTQAMGLDFENPIGLAAGLDKNGDYIDALASLGFGFLEIGTVTPLAQKGHPKPRLFRIPESQALINRMGFNNKGIDYLLERVRRATFKGILGINIGKNAHTPLEEAAQDYLVCFRKAFTKARYITINISSPNTKDLRHLQQEEFLPHLLHILKKEQAQLQALHHKKVPLVVKISPDLNEAQIVALADTLVRHKIEGLIATNTTTGREGITSPEVGGLSGIPLTQRSTEVLRLFKKEVKNNMCLIASGGMMNADICRQKYDAGADLIQLYTGLIYKGPSLIKECIF